MQNNNYLIPANANRGKLILGFFRPIDMIVFGTGFVTTMILIFIFQGDITNWAIAVGVLAPVAVTGFLVLPIPYQHNVMVFLGNIYNFYFVNRQKYYWKGWCNDYGEEKNGK